MSEPSPEAKQAAGWHYKPVSLVGSPKARRFTVYDESGEPIVSVYMRTDAERICSMVNTATAKLREELEDERTLRISYGEQLRRFNFAHQQPSAIITNEQAYRDGTLSQLSSAQEF